MKLRAVVAAMGLLGATTAFAQTVLTLSSWLPPTHTASVSQQKWCEALEKEAKGTIKCNILPKGVAAAPGTFDAVRDGLADIPYTVGVHSPGRFVFAQVAECPYLDESAETPSVA